MSAHKAIADDVVEVVGELIIDDGETVTQQHGARALTVARDMETELASCLADDPAYGPIWRQFQATPQQHAPALAGVMQALLSADAALARRLDDLLDQYRQASHTAIDTGGGAYVGHSVTVQGGSFVGRDSVQITGDGNVIGDGSHATVTKTQGVSGEALARLFDRVYRKIESRPPDADVDKAELTETVEKIQAEVAKGEEANPNKVRRWLETLGLMADDIVEVTVACLLNPAAGVATVIRKVAEKARKGGEEATSPDHE
ncbi:MAG TPA: hypothetical protein ENN19_12695 [Chloroflexi bacterium]|nr:hypothetical protein [Chloroflexota bacterium]